MTASSTAQQTPRAAIWRRARDHFLLEGIERQVRTRRPEQQALVARYHRAALERAAVADDLWDARGTVSSMLLYREAIRLFIAAAVAAHDPSSDPGTVLADGNSPWEALADLSRRALIAEPPGEVEAARKILTASREPLVFDETAPDQLFAQRATVKEAAAWLRNLVEPRTVERIRAERWMRVGLLGVLAIVLLVLVPWSLWRTQNLALRRPVTASSRNPKSIAPDDNSGLVNGEIEGKYGIHTNNGGAWVMVDLESVHPLSTIKVFNRADGWFDEGLPLRLEISEDGQQWKELERRAEHFSATAPWVVKPHGARARYVRVASDNYVALTEMEIY
jgi:hypothetical protein